MKQKTAIINLTIILALLFGLAFKCVEDESGGSSEYNGKSGGTNNRTSNSVKTNERTSNRKPERTAAGDMDYFVGEWEVKKTLGEASTLSINADNTWDWVDYDNNPVSGKWRQVTPNEEPHFGGKNGLYLLQGYDGKDVFVDFYGIREGKEYIQLKASPNFWTGTRTSSKKGAPAWFAPEYKVGEPVYIMFSDGEREGTIKEVIVDVQSASLHYTVSHDSSSSTGRVSPTRLRPR